MLISNSIVFKEPVFNYSGDFPFLWDEIKILVQYCSNYDKAKEILLSLGKSVANDNWVEYTLRYVVNYKKTGNQNRIVFLDLKRS